MPSFTLTDVRTGLWVEGRAITPDSVGLPAQPAWSVTKTTLRGGRRDGVELIELDNGLLKLAIVPTRGMGIWRGQLGEDRIGWDSPIQDGPVHPAHVNLLHWGGLGWLEGFDELLARCGLENNGAPYEVKTLKPDGSESNATYTLHGKIANIPAHFVAVHVQEEPPYAITVEGHVDEAKLFGPKIRMVAKVTTVPGARTATVRDEFTNLGDMPAEMQLLYHWNLGPPYLGEGARLVAPARTVVPRDARAVEGLGHHDVYGPPQPGTTEQVYFFELHGEGPEGRTLAMLRDPSGGRGFVLRFARGQLPCFTLWKNTAGEREGYVTGLEPATNYPNPKPFEAQRGRVVTLPPGGSFVAETVLEICRTRDEVAAIEAEVARLQAQGAPTIHPGPVEPFAAG